MAQINLSETDGVLNLVVAGIDLDVVGGKHRGTLPAGSSAEAVAELVKALNRHA